MDPIGLIWIRHMDPKVAGRPESLTSEKCGNRLIWPYLLEKILHRKFPTRYQDKTSGPINDRTYRSYFKGKYSAFVRNPSNHSDDEVATASYASTPLVRQTGQFCGLRLNYYMFGKEEEVGELRVYV